MSDAPFNPDTAFSVAAQRLGLPALPPEIKNTEYHYALLRLSALDARFADLGSLSWSDRIVVAQFLGCAIAARALAAERSGLSSVVTQVRTAEGSGVTFAANAPDAPESLMTEATEALALVSFLRTDTIARAQSVSTFGIAGRRRARRPAAGGGCPRFLTFGLSLLDLTASPFGCAGVLGGVEVYR